MIAIPQGPLPEDKAKYSWLKPRLATLLVNF